MTLNAFSVDVEEAFQVSALSSVIERRCWGSQESRVVANTSRVMDLLDRTDTRGTFFVLGWIAERHADLIRSIVDRGHELACHGWAHELIYQQSPAQFREQTMRAKKLLEDLSGVEVLGYRAASFSIRRDSLWALDTLVECGFRYDSSIFPVRHDVYGMPGADTVPGRLDHHDLIEFPMTTAAIAGVRVPVSGGGYFRLYPYWLTRALLQRVRRSGAPVMFYVHPWEVDPEQPVHDATGLARFRHYNNLDKCEARLEKLLGDFEFTTVKHALGALGLLQSS